MKSTDRKRLRQIAHHLQPVVTIGEGGVSDAVVNETQRALEDHELIKVKILSADREARVELGNRLVAACHAEVVQRIGKMVVLYRPNPKAKPELSNIARASPSR